jgi:hypothetical protein
MEHIILDEDVYYFLSEYDGNYIPMFIGHVTNSIISNYKCLKQDGAYTHVQIEANCHRFQVYIDKPFYLVKVDSDVEKYASDDHKLDMYPNGGEDNDTDRYVPYPKYFRPGIETLFFYKIEDRLYIRAGDLWAAVDI